MTRFGDFTIHAQVGASAVADAVIATHDALGGPFYVKQYHRLDPAQVRDLVARADRLVGCKSPHLLEHLGHGVVDGTPFTVAPIIEGIDLTQFISSLKERRVSLGLDLLLYMARELARAVLALRALPVDAQGLVMTHGDVSAPHVRVTKDGNILLTGIATPRGMAPGVPSQPVWDGAGVAAAVYDLLPLLRPGTTRPPLPGPLERVVRRSLGIVPAQDAIAPEALVDHLDEAALMMKVAPQRDAFARVAARAIEAVHKNLEADGDPPLRPGVIPIQAAAADALPMLEPINLESIAELSPESLEGEAVARVEIVSVPPEAVAAVTSSSSQSPQPSDKISLPHSAPDTHSLAESTDVAPAPKPVAPRQVASPAPAPSPISSQAPPPPMADASFSAVTAPLPTPPRAGEGPPADEVSPSTPKTQKRNTEPLGTPALFSTPTETTKTPAARPDRLAQTLGIQSAPTDEVTFPFSPTPDGAPPLAKPSPAVDMSAADKRSLADAAPFPPLERNETSIDFLDSTATQSRAGMLAATTTGPDQSAILTAEGEGGHQGLTPPGVGPSLLGEEPSFDSLPELDTSDVMEIPSDPLTAIPPPNVPETTPASMPPVHTRPTPGGGPRTDPNPAARGLAGPRGLFADPPDDAVNVGGPKDDSRFTATDDDTDPGRETSEEAFESDDEAAGFIEEKTLPNLDLNLNPDTDTEQSVPKTDVKIDPPPAVGKAVQALLTRGVITNAHVKTAVAAQKERGGRLLEILVQLQAATDAKVADVLAEAALRPRISEEGLAAQRPSADICKKLPQTYAQNRRLLPLVVVDDTLTLAVVDPFATADIEEVRVLLRAEKVAVKIATRAALTDAIVEAYRNAGLHRTKNSDVTQGIILCSPDDSLAERIGQRLVTEGFSIELADTSTAARAALENRIAHAVLCDTNLTGDEDAALLRFARGNERLEDTPFFVYGPEDDALEARVLDLGADDFFSVPFNLDVLVKKLRRAISKTADKTDALLAQQAKKAVRPKKKSERSTSLLDEAPPVEAPMIEAPLAIPRMVTMVGAVPGLERLRDLPDLSDVGEPAPEPVPPPTSDALDPFAAPPTTNVPMGEPTGVMGTLRQMSVSEIVQSLELGRKSARVELVPSYGERGALAFTGGQVVYAECNDLRGEEAFFVLASQQEGFFRIHYGVEPDEKNIEKPSMFLLLEAARKADEESEGVDS